MKDPNKPPYRVPSMEEINALPWNGFKVASTFSGCGGSCLGYRMAGFKVVWANEFVPIAQESYRANKQPDCVLDPRDIKTVTAQDILTATGLKVGELDLFDGSPPCQAFSTAGKREKGWGKEKSYEHGAKQCNETLFDEYIRLVQGLQPKVFIAENVSGLVKGTAKGHFLRILAALKACGYQVECRVCDAQWLGVPQMRQRTIFVGVRNDLCEKFGVRPVHPAPLPYFYSVRDALPWMVSVPRMEGNHKAGISPGGTPSPSITTSGFGGSSDKNITSKVMIEGSNGFNKHKGSDINQPLPTVQAGRPLKVIHDSDGKSEKRFVKNHDVTNQPCPTITNGIGGMNSCYFKVESETSIKEYAIGKEYAGLGQGKTHNKYISLAKPHPDGPCNCVSATGGHCGTASVVHPTEKRKFSIAELKRICGFPDDFVLIGKYAQQWERLGNSVPPVMMAAIAKVVRDKILIPCNPAKPKPVRKRSL